jgi:DNA-binding response OmpR family regulator
MLVLLVEDEVPLAKLVCEYLAEEGIETDHAITANHAKQLLDKHDFDVLILDINLPDMSGFEFCKQQRDRGINIPTIMLTARHTLEDKEQGFRAGTDDYLVKPFAMQELVMRLRALKQRANRSDKIQLGKLQLEVSQHKALINDKQGQYEIILTPDEWRLLLLLSRENKTVAREKIFDQMWPDGSGTDDGLKMLLFRLRKTLSLTLESAQLSADVLQIITVRSIGLRLEYRE